MLRRVGFKSNLPPRQAMLEPRPIRQTAPVSFDVVGQPKAERLKGGVDEQLHKDGLVELGCMVCWRVIEGYAGGPVVLHHFRGGGWGKGDYRTLMPLCQEHHVGASGVHGMGTKAFARFYGFDQQDLLNDALNLLTNPAKPQ